MEQLSDRRRELQALYKEKQATLSAKAVETALSYLPVAEAAAGLVAELDVLTSFATVAATASGNYCRPNILPLGSGVIDIQVDTVFITPILYKFEINPVYILP